MAYIELSEGLPGILGPMAFSPETAKPLNELAEVLLRGENSLTSGERELIAARVSYGNNCHFCHSSHGAAAAHHLGGDSEMVEGVKRNGAHATISAKLEALLGIADKVRAGGQEVDEEDITQARECGATDKEIHDTVLIAAAFCMYNRYVDGLGTWAPKEAEAYEPVGQRLAEEGYVAVGEQLGELSEQLAS